MKPFFFSDCCFSRIHFRTFEFILEDIGVLRFETYDIRKEDRFFSDRTVVDDLLFMSQIRSELWIAIQENDLRNVLTLGDIIKNYDCHKKVKPKAEKSFGEIGRFLEKHKLWQEALSYYELSSLSPANERKVRVLDKIGCFEKAFV